MSIERSICPDIYHPAIARDGLLTRLRIPGGSLDAVQCLEIADLLAMTGLVYIQVTNRANLQLRALTQDLDRELLTKLADCGLAANNTAVDGIRNMMISPTAGIDTQELIDIRPLAMAWHNYLIEHPELGMLSTKFSVGFDGGGSVSIIDRPNDISLLAVAGNDLAVEFDLYLGMGDRGTAPLSVGVRLTLADCIPMLAAIAQSYRQGIEELGGDLRRKPRLRDVIQHWGLTSFNKIVQREFKGCGQFIFKNSAPDCRNPHTDIHAHLGVWAQRQTARSYLGIVLPLGRWTAAQVRALAAIATQYGSGTIRLTPWQNLIIPDLATADVAKVQQLVTELGLVQTANHPISLLRACAGTTGCQFATTDTQHDAITISQYLESNFTLDRPINIHLSGCDKSCAQHDRADITLWGQATGNYRLCVSGDNDRFGRGLTDNLTTTDAPMAIGNLLQQYHRHRASPTESFRAVSERYALE